MKKIALFLTVFSLCFALVACDSGKAAVSSQTATNESSETASEEQSSAVANSEKEEISSAAASAEAQTSTSSKVSESSQKPVSTSSKKQSSTVNPSSSSQKPASTSSTASKQTESKTEEPYYVGYELVSIERTSTKTHVDGMHIFDKVYGKNKVLQKGDVVTYKIIMSDGGSDFTVIKSPIYGDFAGHDYKVNGNLVTITANGSYQDVEVWIKARKKDDKTEPIELGYFNQLCYDGDLLENEVYSGMLLKDLARNLGMDQVSGFDIGNQNRVVIYIPDNDNWLTEAVHAIENWHKMGLKRFSLTVIYCNAFDGVAGA